MNNPAAPALARTQDDRILAALAHAGVILPFWGTIGAVALWATQRQKSAFVGFQSLQAAAYQLILVLGGFLLGFCYMCSAFAPLFAVMLNPTGVSSTNEVDPLFFGPFLFSFALIFLGMFAWLIFVVYGLIGAAMVFQGRDFRYLIVGTRLKAYLEST